jgi:hypothetical protein
MAWPANFPINPRLKPDAILARDFTKDPALSVIVNKERSGQPNVLLSCRRNESAHTACNSCSSEKRAERLLHAPDLRWLAELGSETRDRRE